MKKIILSATAMFVGWCMNAAVIYVDVDAIGSDNGTSWANAYDDLQDALAAASAMDEIWVAEGTYYPTGGTNRSISFEMQEDVAIYGGFDGTETTRSQRDWVNHETILSGDIDRDGLDAGNSYNVVTNHLTYPFNFLDSDAILDGFTITEAYNNEGGVSNPADGAAIKLFECGGIIRNCRIHKNAGELSIVFTKDVSTFSDKPDNVVFENCLFHDNIEISSDFDFFAIYTYDSDNSDTTFIDSIVNCTFYGEGSESYGVYANGGIHMYNSIVWRCGDTAVIPDDSTQSMLVKYSDIEGGYTGTGNINSDPKFVSTTNDNYRLLCTSPCLDAGNDTYATTVDLDGNDRTFGTVDMGCYEKQFGSGWTEVAEILASDGEVGDRYGFNVAISGTYAIVGAPREDEDGSNAGAAYIFEFVNGTWQQVQKILSSDSATTGDNFGYSVDIDGDKVVVGAKYDDDNGSNAGAAFVYERNVSGVWVFDRKLTASDGASDDFFGHAVGISGDKVIVGAPRDHHSGLTDAGTVYIYDISGSTSESIIRPSGLANSDEFGQSVAIDGNTAVIGSWLEDDGDGTDDGAAYIYVFSGSWSLDEKLNPSDDSNTSNISMLFGCSVDLDDANDLVLVGARGADLVNGTNSGAVYLFDISGTTSETIIRPSTTDGDASDFFGQSVSISGDKLVVGAQGDDDDGSAAGAAYIYENNSGWSLDEKITASAGAAGDFFGYSVGISGANVCIGAYGDAASGSEEGTAYIFQTCDGAPSTQMAAYNNGLTFGNEETGEDGEFVQPVLPADDKEAENVDNTSISATSGQVFNVYPNPSNSGLFNMDIRFDNDLATSVQVIDVYGKTILSENVIQGNMVLDISNYSKGVYFVKVINGKQIKTQKLMFK